MAQDGVGASSFAITHEFLANILGVQRAGVSLKVNALQKDGLISYTRGRMTIEDSARLESSACECYATMRAEIDRIFKS